MTPVNINESIQHKLEEQAALCGPYCKVQDLMRELITELNV